MAICLRESLEPSAGLASSRSRVLLQAAVSDPLVGLLAMPADDLGIVAVDCTGAGSGNNIVRDVFGVIYNQPDNALEAKPMARIRHLQLQSNEYAYRRRGSIPSRRLPSEKC